MFSQSVQFFPSTEELARQVYYAAQIEAKNTVLDPTAGNGVLLDAVSEYKRQWDRVQTFAIEIDQELRFILQGKGHKVIGTDFLEYADPLKFDRIIMNPPFANGAEMVLKAWNQHLKDGGRLVSILNRETINNPFSGDRKALKALIEQYGNIKELGQAFKNAARKTDVEVIMIVLEKPKRTGFDFAGASFSHDEVTAEEFQANPLAHTSVIKNLVAKYKACEAIVVHRHETQDKLNFYLDGVSRRVYTGEREEEIELHVLQDLSSEIAELKSRFWNTVFDKTELIKKATSSFRQKFTDYTAQQRTMEFSEQNIVEMLSMFFLNREEIMNDCIIDVFDKATGFHEKNCIHKEGWKTNKSFKLNKRIIHPDGVEFCKIMQTIRVGWSRQSFLDDLDKVLCWISGQSIDNPDFVGTYKAIETFCNTVYSRKPERSPLDAAFFRSNAQWAAQPRLSYTDQFESTFFKIRIYKKGTMHLDFKDLYLLDDFNLAAAKGKRWIGADY